MSQPMAALSGRVRRLGSAVLDQALLSASNFVAAIVLIRNSSNEQYGYYVLATNAVLLLITLQNGFFGAPMINQLTRLPLQAQGQMAAGLSREQRGLLLICCAALFCVAAAARVSGLISGEWFWVSAAFSACVLAMLNREFFRMVLLAHRRTDIILVADVSFVAVLMGGVWFATKTARPGAAAVLAFGAAATLGGILLAVAARRHRFILEPGTRGMLRKLAPAGAWAATGGAIHWIYGQGYSYLIAGTLDVSAIAAVSATRLLMMPLNLMSTGVAQLLLPTASGWLYREGAATVLRRLLWIGAAMSAVSLIYFAVIWQLRGWIYKSLLHQDFAGRDLLFCLWAGIFGLMVVRDQLLFLPVLRERFRTLAGLSSVCAGIAIALSYPAMHRFGAGGALVGMLAGELLNIAGIAVLVTREVRLSPAAYAEAV